MSATVVAAHGGQLKDLTGGSAPVGLERLPFLKLNPRQQCAVEMLLSGTYSPLDGFQGRDDYLAVLQTSRLADGTLWPMPVVLDVERAALGAIGRAAAVALLDAELNPVALLKPGESWQPDLRREAKALFGTDDPRHPGARALLHDTAPHYLSGKLEGLRLPVCRSFEQYRVTPREQRRRLAANGAAACLALFARHPLFHAGAAALDRALAACGAEDVMVLHNPDFAASGAAPGRVTARCLLAVMPRLQKRAAYCRVAHEPRFAGARDAIWDAIVAQNYGATHLMVDISPAADARAGHAGELLEAATRELAIRLIDAGAAALPGESVLKEALEAGGEAASQIAFPEEIAVLRPYYRARRGFALFLTGLSGAGKSSLAHRLVEDIESRFGRAVTVLDGDYSRYLLTSDLGIAPGDQQRNVARHAYVAAEIVRHGGIAICALVAPDAAGRAAARAAVEAHGRFVEAYLSAPPQACEQRDQKGIYARGRLLGAPPPAPGAGYEIPLAPEIVLDSVHHGVEQLSDQVLAYLVAEKLLAPRG